MTKQIMKKGIEERIELPPAIEISIGDRNVHFKKGSLESNIHFSGFAVRIDGNQLIISSPKSTKNERRSMNTFKAHLQNIFQGFDKRYTYKLQICAVHFPMTVTFDKTKHVLVVKNFLGERVPRTAGILPGVDVKVEKEVIVLESHNKEAVGQSAANIESATRITKRDRRVFQDGIWITEKAGEAI